MGRGRLGSTLCPPARLHGRAAVPRASAAACLASDPGELPPPRSRLGASSTTMSSACAPCAPSVAPIGAIEGVYLRGGGAVSSEAAPVI